MVYKREDITRNVIESHDSTEGVILRNVCHKNEMHSGVNADASENLSFSYPDIREHRTKIIRHVAKYDEGVRNRRRDE